MSPILYFVIGLIALGGAIAAVSWLARANPATLARALTWLAAALGAGVVAFVLLRFAPQFLPLVLLIGVPLLLSRRGWFRSRPWRRGPGTARAGDASAVETAYLRMSLDHASGAMNGQVLRGGFAGRELGALTLDELIALRSECAAADPQSVRLVESFIDRSFGPDWRTARAGAGDGAAEPDQETGGGASAAQADMSRADALEILGLPPDADREAIVAAWRKLIKLNHPDHGGSKYIAAKLNEAKRVLLGD